MARSMLPFLRWLPPARGHLRADCVAGVTVALLLIPQAMAYAQLAGLPAHYGLYTALVPTIVAALFGWCGQLHTGPVAMTSLLTYTVIAQSGVAASGSEAQFAAAAVCLSLLSGLILLAAGVLRLAMFVNFLSQPVVHGFTNAAAIIIAISQLPLLLGLGGGGDGFLAELAGLVLRLPETHLPTLAFGAGAVVFIVLMRKAWPGFPGVLAAVLLSILASRELGFAEHLGGQVVGEIPAGLPGLAWPVLTVAMVRNLLGGAVMIALIGFMEVLAISKVIAAQTRERTDFDQELIGQGMGKLAGAFCQCFPVSGSFSRSALNLYAGAKTGLSSLVAGGCVMLFLLFLTPLLHHLPKATLGAVIVVAVAGLVKPGVLLRSWRVDRGDGVSALVAFASVLLLAPRIVEGVLVGAGCAIAFHLYRLMQPHVAFLARHPDGTFRDAARHDLRTEQGVMIIRFEGRLVFANASHFEETVLEALAEARDTRAVIFQADSINAIDATGEETLRNLVAELRQNGLVVAISEAKWRLTETLARADFFKVLPEEHFFRTIDDAYQAVKQRLAEKN